MSRVLVTLKVCSQGVRWAAALYAERSSPRFTRRTALFWKSAVFLATTVRLFIRAVARTRGTSKGVESPGAHAHQSQQAAPAFNPTVTTAPTSIALTTPSSAACPTSTSHGSP